MNQPGALRGDGLSRFSLNTATVRAGLLETIDASAKAGIQWIAPWREQFAELPVEQAAKAVRDVGLRVSSLCRGGFFPAPTEAERRARIKDNRRAVDEAATLGTDVLVLVCGGVVGKDLGGSRQMVEDGIAELLPYAEERGVRLGIEPLHPMFGADRSVIVTLGQANAMARRLRSAWVGVVIDVYHVWWDPQIDEEIGNASGITLGFHVNDWIVPLPDILNGRGVMGDGVIDLGRLRRAVDDEGYAGPIEVEIFNEELRSMGLERSLEMLKSRFRQAVAG